MAHRRPAGGTSSPSSVTDNENAIRLLESLQNDFKSLSMETKKKYPQIKEASEEAIVKLRNSAAVAADHLQQQQQSHHHHHQIYYVVNQILYPVVQGCETKEPKIVKMCLGTIQKLITHRAVDQKGARYITDTLWMLMESGTEHVKVLQSVTLLLTTDCVVRGETLARNLVLCFRLHFTKDSQAVINTAGATVRQLVALVFERVLYEDEQLEQQLKDSNDDNNRYDTQQQRNGTDSSVPIQDPRQQQSSRTSPLPQLHHHHQYNGSNASGTDIANAVSSLGPCAADAFNMFQDLVRLVNTDRPYWLVGMTEMTRTFGLELLESVLSDFQPVFYKHMEFRYLLKERVCALVIKLFSPNVKHHSGSGSGRRNTITNTGTGASSGSGNNSSSVMMMGVTGGTGGLTSNHRGDDRPHYAITVRLLRLVSILVRKYHKLLITECEIFLSLIVKFLDADKPAWQRAVALEVLHRLVVEPGLLAAFCACYDLKLHSTKIFRDIIDSLAGYVQSLFNPAMVASGGGLMNNAAMMATTHAALQGQSPAVLAGMPVGPGVSPQPGFLGRGGVWLPVVIQLPTGQAKSIYLEMNDKHDEPPQVAFGYGVSVAYACLVDAVRAIQIEVSPDIHQPLPPSTTGVSSSDVDDSSSHHQHTDGDAKKNTPVEDVNDEDDQQQTAGVKRSPLHEQIINSSWCGLLTTFCPLIESCTDEGITENMLKAMQAYIGLCGLLDMRGPRDAFITAVCRACLPPHYNLTVFSGSCCVVPQSMSSSTPTVQYTTSGTMYDDHHHQQYSSTTGGGYGPESADYKQQQQVIVAVGTPLATPSSVLQALSSSSSSASLQNHGPVMLTAKNLQCMRALLVLAHCHGSILGSSWHLVLTTLQHLVWILGLKPSTGGSLKAGNSAATSVPNRHTSVTTSATAADGTVVGTLSSSSSSVATTSSSSNVAVITTAVMAADLPVLSTMLSRLFESSRYLDDVALHHLIDALCKLSHEAMELAYCNREPSLFAVAKLLETGLVNLSRIDILWRPVTNHMLDVCQHPHIRMREWGVEAITYLVKAALQYKYQPPLKDNQKLQTLLLSPLSQLSLNMHGDVRQRQLECVLQVLHGSGQTLSHGWPLVLNIVGAVSDRHGENLIRIAFQCLELVLTDFLPLMPCKCLPLCLETTAKFGMQTRDLNISLTALGLMWNVADYFKDNKDKLLYNNSSGDNSKQQGTNGEVLADGNTMDVTMAGITLTDPQELVYPDFPGVTTLAEMSEFDKLWMCLFTKLGELCIDPRPAVRKSAGQTLLSTISAHANLLTPSSWNAVLWQVLFPLMNKVQMLCESASDSTCNTVAASDGTGGSVGGGSGGNGSAGGGTILIHHSRNTDQKQWAETQVSTLYGLARVFNAEKYSMTVGGDFVKAWTLLLEYMEKAALNRNVEVSLAGLRSLHELLMVYSNSNNVGDDTNMATANDKNSAAMDRLQREKDWQNKNGISGSAATAQSSFAENEIWTCTWTVWMRIATAATETTVVDSPTNLPPTTTASSGSSIAGAEDRRRREYQQPQHHQSLQHKQKFLTALLQIFPLIFTRIKTRFTDNDLNDLFRVLDAAAAVDGSAAVVLSDHHHQYYHHQQQLQQQNYYGGSYSQQQLTRLQDEILQCLETLERETLIFDDDEFNGVGPLASIVVDNTPVCSGAGDIDKKNSTASTEQHQQRDQLVQRFLCPLFDQLLKFCRFVCPPLPPPVVNTVADQQQLTNGAAAIDHFHHHNKFAAAVAVDSNYVAFGEKAVLMIVDLYAVTAAEKCVVKNEILRRIIEVFSVPLAGRYSSYPSSAPSFHYHLDVTSSSSGTTQQQQQQHVQQQQQQHLMLVRRRQQQQQNTWKLLVVGLMNVLSVGVPLARDSSGNDYISIWSPLGSVLEDILFPKNLPPASAMLKSNKLVDDNDENDSVIIDCQLVEFLKDEILSQSTNVPREFIMRVVVLLNRGSVLSTTTTSTLPNYPYGGGGYDTMMMVDCRDGSVSGGVVSNSGVGGFSPPSLLREQFAKVCFETLLQFSLVDGISSSSSPSSSSPADTTAASENSGGIDSNADAELITGKLAVTALLHRFQEVVEKFCHDQSLTGKCPLPRYRMSEISFVLKAIATLIVSLKKTPDKVSKAVWDQLVRLYPCLVRCVPYTQQCCSSPQVTDSLTEALLQYGDLLLKAPPSTAADAQQQ